MSGEKAPALERETVAQRRRREVGVLDLHPAVRLERRGEIPREVRVHGGADCELCLSNAEAAFLGAYIPRREKPADVVRVRVSGEIGVCALQNERNGRIEGVLPLLSRDGRCRCRLCLRLGLGDLPAHFRGLALGLYGDLPGLARPALRPARLCLGGGEPFLECRMRPSYSCFIRSICARISFSSSLDCAREGGAMAHAKAAAATAAWILDMKAPL